MSVPTNNSKSGDIAQKSRRKSGLDALKALPFHHSGGNKSTLARAQSGEDSKMRLLSSPPTGKNRHVSAPVCPSGMGLILEDPDLTFKGYRLFPPRASTFPGHGESIVDKPEYQLRWERCKRGRQPGMLRGPKDVCFVDSENLAVVEEKNSRIQFFNSNNGRQK